MFVMIFDIDPTEKRTYINGKKDQHPIKAIRERNHDSLVISTYFMVVELKKNHEISRLKNQI